jgi:hypothetical protein
MNFLLKIIQDNKEKIFVIDYKDDVLSLICYKLIKNLQSVCSFKFKIYLYGKTFNTKKDLVKKEKKIFSFRLKKEIKNDNVILISPYNPIYEVLKSNVQFNNFNCPIYKPFQFFTVQQIEQTQIFYHIGYYKKDLLQINSNNTLLLEYKKFCEQSKSLIDFFNKNYYNDIILLKLTGNNEEDEVLLNQVEDYDGLIFYYYNNIYPQLLDSNFSYFLKNKTNVPSEYNVNNADIPIKIIREFGSYPQFIGSWKENEKDLYDKV